MPKRCSSSLFSSFLTALSTTSLKFSTSTMRLNTMIRAWTRPKSCRGSSGANSKGVKRKRDDPAQYLRSRNTRGGSRSAPEEGLLRCWMERSARRLWAAVKAAPCDRAYGRAPARRWVKLLGFAHGGGRLRSARSLVGPLHGQPYSGGHLRLPPRTDADKFSLRGPALRRAPPTHFFLSRSVPWVLRNIGRALVYQYHQAMRIPPSTHCSRGEGAQNKRKVMYLHNMTHLPWESAGDLHRLLARVPRCGGRGLEGDQAVEHPPIDPRRAEHGARPRSSAASPHGDSGSLHVMYLRRPGLTQAHGVCNAYACLVGGREGSGRNGAGVSFWKKTTPALSV